MAPASVSSRPVAPVISTEESQGSSDKDEPVLREGSNPAVKSDAHAINRVEVIASEMGLM